MDYGECETDTAGIIDVRLAFTHQHGSVSYFDQQFVVSKTIKQLKEDMQNKLGAPAHLQIWTHKGYELDDAKTLMMTSVDDGDTIEVICQDY